MRSSFRSAVWCMMVRSRVSARFISGNSRRVSINVVGGI
jgi:hypothetical protein